MAAREPSTDIQQLFRALDNGATLVTVNNRLARDLLERYEQSRLAAGESVWQTPDILPLASWLRREYQRLHEQGHMRHRLLGPHQEQLLWEQVVRRQQPSLLQPRAAARAAASAWNLMQQWQLPADLIRNWGSPECRAFDRWRHAYEQRCDELGAIGSACLPTLLTRHPGITADALWLAGFDELAPDLRGLFDALAQQGITVRQLDIPEPRCTPGHFTAVDTEEEYRVIARWALGRLRRNPQARIAIVCPDIIEQREPLRRVLQHTLDPAGLVPGNTGANPFNFSLGLPLADQPLSSDALLLLELPLHGLELPALGRLLRSPYLGGSAAEGGARALLDVMLRRRGRPRYRLTDLLRITAGIAADAPHHCPDLHDRLQRLAAQQRQGPQLPGDWGASFLQWLEQLGWPGGRSLDSREYQEAQALREQLQRLAELDALQGRCSAAEALQQLQQLAAENLFQPEGSNAPVQVLGVLEAAGLDFDHLWLMGLDEAHWPPAPAPNPLLPAGLQRERAMPHASPERELQYAQQVTRRLLASADEVVLSHPAQGEEGARRPSPLLAAIDPLRILDSGQLALDPGPDMSPAAPLQPLRDWQAPPLQEQQPRGGTSLLADQAACPFRACARHRLGLEPLEEASYGPDAALVGSLVHLALEGVWRRLQDQQTLTTSAEEVLDDLTREAARQALDEVARRRPDLYHGRFRELEHDRLSTLLRDWLAREASRPPFRIASLERREQIAIGPLRLQVRADRVDELADGRLLVIDYKTGQGDPTRRWLDARTGEPQVPLYCIQQAEHVAGAAIARVRSDHRAGFVGLSAAPLDIEGIEVFDGSDTLADWPALLEHWRRQLTALAEEIADGRADPTPGTDNCRYCPLPALCRVGFHEAEDHTDD